MNKKDCFGLNAYLGTKPLLLTKIAELVALSKDENANDNESVEFGFFPNWQAQQINQLTQVKLNDAVKKITVYGIRHAIKVHGDDAEQKERIQIGVTDADFDLIPKIVNSFDKVEKGHEKRGNQGVLFVKSIGNIEYYVAMTLRNNKNNPVVEFRTMYKKPIKRPM